MERLLKDGDYLPDGKGGFQPVEGTQELLQRVLFQLSVRRGSFPFLPDLGSELYKLAREKPAAWESLARQYATEALQEMADLTVTGAVVLPQAEGAKVRIYLDYAGEGLSVTLEV